MGWLYVLLLLCVDVLDVLERAGTASGASTSISVVIAAALHAASYRRRYRARCIYSIGSRAS